MYFSQQQRYQTNQKNRLFPCVICKKQTDQTCSLCRKVFYCSAEHQQIDWHMKHKMQCQGKIVQNSPATNQQWNTNQSSLNTIKERQFFASQNRQIQNKSNQIRLENESKHFMTLFQQRLILRKKCVDKYLRLVQTSVKFPEDDTQSLIEQLTQVSSNLLRLFRTGFIAILQQMYGITTSEFILKLDDILDRSLLAKYHLLTHRHEQVRRYLFLVNQQLPLYPGLVDSRFRQVYENVLKTVMNISQAHCNDKVTESILAKYVLLVQKFDGTWEQVYAYFNMGNWYLKRTYNQKGIKCFNYSLQLLETHKVRQNTQSSTLVKADLMFNIAISRYCLGNQKQGFDQMQKSYRLRSKAVGKNAIQASQCLQCLSRWAFASKYWEDCLQYAKQCYRVRKLNVNYPKELQDIQQLLQNIYSQLRKQKQKSQQQMSVKPAKYYQSLMSPSKLAQQAYSRSQPQQSFIKQLNSTVKQQLTPFKVIITPEMAQTYTSNQWQTLTKLLDMTDQMMHKQQMRRIVFESQFTESLHEEQKDAFIKLNRID